MGVAMRIYGSFAGKVLEIVVTVSERYALNGTDPTRMTLDGTDSARLVLDGTDDQRMTLEGL